MFSIYLSKMDLIIIPIQYFFLHILSFSSKIHIILNLYIFTNLFILFILLLFYQIIFYHNHLILLLMANFKDMDLPKYLLLMLIIQTHFFQQKVVIHMLIPSKHILNSKYQLHIYIFYSQITSKDIYTIE